MRFVLIYILLIMSAGIEVTAQIKDSVCINIEQLNTDRILLLQRQQHLLGMQIEEHHNLKGIKLSDTLYIYIHKKNNRDSIVSYFGNIVKQLDSLNKYYYKNGYIFNKLKADSINIKNNKIHIYYTLKNTTILQIDSLYFSKKIPENISKYLNKHYISKKMNNQNIRAINDFITQNTVFITQKNSNIFFKRNKNILNINIKKTQKNSLDGLLGFRYDNADKKLSLTGEVNGTLYNSFNANEKIHFRWQKNTQTQNYLIDGNFPYIRGSNFGLRNIFLTQRKDSTEIVIYNRFTLTWQTKKHLFSLHYTINNLNQIITGKQKNEYLGLGYRFRWTTKSNLERFGIYNETINTISINTKANQIGFFSYNQLNYILKIFSNQGIKITGVNYFSNENLSGQFLTTKSNIYRNNYLNPDNLKSLQIIKSAYYFVNNKQIFYSIHDFVNTNTLSNQTKTYINIGIGTQILRKNQNLTLQVYIPIFISKTTDNQDVYISIRQTLRF